MTKLQIAMEKEELERIYTVLNKAMSAYQTEKGDKYTYRSTIVRLVEEYGRLKGFINGDDTIVSEVESIKKNPKELQYAETIVKQFKRNPNQSNQRALYDLVYRIEPKFSVPNDTDSKQTEEALLAVIADKLGVV